MFFPLVGLWFLSISHPYELSLSLSPAPGVILKLAWEGWMIPEETGPLLWAVAKASTWFRECCTPTLWEPVNCPSDEEF